MRQLTNNNLGIKGKYKIITTKAGTKEVLRETGWIDNLVVSGSGGYGRNIVARQLIGDTTYQIEIDSASLGDDNTAPTNNDTSLGNALKTGIVRANQAVNNNVLTIDFFIPDASLTNDTYEEIGLFCNSRLFARSIISPAYTKATGEDTTIQYTITIN